ncbi:MAG: dCMP deaminase family protein [Mycoplasmataceae bacterium]|nr:dCMP deaminase family protein [Mycoplasmataceae bacterium]
MRKNQEKLEISWEEYFMGIALMVAQKSHDPSSKVGAVIVNEKNQIVATGYNDFPEQVKKDSFSWAREGEWLETKYPYVVHAEMNALANRTQSFTNCTLYVTLAPCNECAKNLVAAGIKEVCFYEDKYPDKREFVAAKRMLDKAKVKWHMYEKKGKKVEIEL